MKCSEYYGNICEVCSDKTGECVYCGIKTLQKYQQPIQWSDIDFMLGNPIYDSINNKWFILKSYGANQAQRWYATESSVRGLTWHDDRFYRVEVSK